MATTATVRINIHKEEKEAETEKEWDKMTLMEKFRHQYKHRNEDGAHHSDALKRYAYMMITFQILTQPYLTLFYIIPRYFEEYDEWAQYSLKVFAMFLIIETLTNYFCTVFYSTDIKKSRDNPTIQMKDRTENPPEYFESLISNQSSSNGHAPHSLDVPYDDNGLPLKYCKKCELYQPPRAHHCPICKKCILKRDHHCYFVGTCIGFRNQRYFFVLNFYAACLGIFSFYITLKYLQAFYWPNAYSWTDFFPPLAFFRWLTGTGNLSLHIVILITHLYNEFVFGLLGSVYFISQTFLVIKGITLNEMTKEARVKSNNTINHNFRSVFGDFWLLNFFFPMIILFKQREDGYKWEGVKIDYNRNYDRKGYE